MTRGVNDAVAKNTEFAKFILICLSRYRHCDWGDLDTEDKQANNRALEDEQRIIAAYRLPKGIKGPAEKIWIITEWDRSFTTILWPSEY